MASMATTNDSHYNSDTNSDEEYDYKKEFANDKPDTQASHVGIVLNGCYGGFGLSDWAKGELGITSEYCYGINRFNPALVKLVENYDVKKVSGSYSNLYVEYIPIGYYQGKDTGNSHNKRYYTINEYDGVENIVLNSAQYASDQRQKASERKQAEVEHKTKEREHDIQALMLMFSGILLDEGLTPDQKVYSLKLFFPEGDVNIDRCIECLQENHDYTEQFLDVKRSLQ